jgi:hypothetical protein
MSVATCARRLFDFVLERPDHAHDLLARASSFAGYVPVPDIPVMDGFIHPHHLRRRGGICGAFGFAKGANPRIEVRRLSPCCLVCWVLSEDTPLALRTVARPREARRMIMIAIRHREGEAIPMLDGFVVVDVVVAIRLLEL